MIADGRIIQSRNEQDSAWKDILDCYFREFVEYCLPQLSKLVDWNKSWVSLDKEFQALTKEAETGKRLLDKLFKVYLQNGQEQWVLVHIEVQGQKENDFPERMFLYEARIYDKYRRGVVGCAVLTDSNPVWRPNYYEISVVSGSSLRAEFIVIKLMDYQAHEAELEKSTNPFADVILVQLAAMNLRGEPDEKRKWIKFALTKRLYEKGYTREKVMNLYKFIDWVIGLPKILALEYMQDVHVLEEATRMAYITSAELIGMEKGLEQGLQQGLEQGMQKAGIIFAKLAQGIDVKVIAQEIGLSLEQVESFKKLVNSH